MYGTPEIFNTDQGSRLTSFDFTVVLKVAGIASPWMEGAAAWTHLHRTCGARSNTRRSICTSRATASIAESVGIAD